MLYKHNAGVLTQWGGIVDAKREDFLYCFIDARECIVDANLHVHLVNAIGRNVFDPVVWTQKLRIVDGYALLVVAVLIPWTH